MTQPFVGRVRNRETPCPSGALSEGPGSVVLVDRAPPTFADARGAPGLRPAYEGVLGFARLAHAVRCAPRDGARGPGSGRVDAPQETTQQRETQ